MTEELCGEWSGDPYEGGVTCTLPKGHPLDVDHYAEVRWPQSVPRDPSLPPREPSAMELMMAKIWRPVIEQHLAVLEVVGRECVVNRDSDG